ncbi:NFX1-type zinc finger-containing protein 1 [Daldinia childiae]|uniref:NFX1-type zinc finger-containing protein 1 n=2 Tax=Daldinia childiae TaxID=326645 RepID=UPI0014461D70|nr:NFX1-type zinc finger-containing protein 1 [Daldinia childiae]KAF3061545.1 NFX1-type zinc finger-containing protein 1 [Daldinia childiae]
MANDDQYGVSACELSLSVLATVIDCNTSNIVNDNFTRIVKGFESPIQAANLSPNEFSRAQARKHLQYLQRRLKVGDALTEAKTAKKAPVTRAEFILRKDLPGRLSADGPRHDNDHTDICDIRILPTHEEITSIRNEYLPTTDPSLFHVPGIRGRLDREFRLLREDTVGQLRDAVSAQLKAMKDPKRKQEHGNGNSIRTYAYQQAEIVDASFDRIQGMDLLVQFLQPTSKKSVQQRRDWWSNSKRLQPGGLVCMLSGNDSVLFCVVGDSTIIASDQKGVRKAEENEEPSNKPSLADEDVWAYVHLHLVEARPHDIGQALRWFQNIGPEQQRCLVEFPRVLLPSFQHTLIALQRMSKKSDVPFDEFIAPAKAELDLGVKDVGPPQYTTKPNFSFDLSCLTQDNATLRHSPRRPLDPRELASHSSLDATQSGALLNTLSRKLALIQGPPGTGKSFTGEKIIKVLLANKLQADLGPILCVCYTNHALDQLLVHLMRDGVKIIRIGSRSKSEELEGLNLRAVAKTADRTKAEKGSMWELRSERDEDVRTITQSINDLAACQTPVSIRNYLSIHHKTHHNALFGIEDEEGWQQQQRRKPGQLLGQWRTSGQRENHAPREIAQLIYADVWTMSNAERKRLYNYWLREIRDPLITDIIQKYKSYEHTTDELDKVSRDVDLRCLHEADVVGVTTTGLARNLGLLQKLRCKVMLCEEAGEVLEAHTLTALLPSVEHAILIGDHQQLRPQIVNYELQSTNPRGGQYSLDVSLFERLIQPPYDTDPKLPYDTLETQRRMHPSVSELIRSTLYPRLEDGGPVAQYPEIYGMKKRLFWMHHESPEDREVQPDPMTTSRTNTFEVEMTIALVQHLVRQGSYGSDDIAVITPYLGQLNRLRREMAKLFEISVGERDLEELEALDADQLAADNIALQPHKPVTVKKTLLKSIRLATVDNFQGEEAKVVVISLVRSNAAKDCGFLNTSNRINVLLSRAQHGMYLIGNANTYRHVPMWAKVLDILADNENLGAQLELHCPRHPNPDTPLLVSKADDFLRVAPEGGYFIMGMQYHEIDLNEDPCIFPDCGHFATKTNMDGIMDMKAHYKMSAEDNPVAILNTSEPFSMEEVKVCPTCRGSLRSISRYGRIVRRAMLDESTKKFVSWSQIEYSKLAELLLDVQGRISTAPPPPRVLQKDTRSNKKVFSAGRVKQIQLIRDWVGDNRYEEAFKLWQRINNFLGQVRREEQPFQRVNDFVLHATRQQKTQGVFAFDETRIQIKGHLQACTLSLKCDIIVVTDFMKQRDSLTESRGELNLDFSLQLDECESLAERAKATGYPRQETEAHVYFAQFCAFSRVLVSAEKAEDGSNTNAVKAEKFKEKAKEHLALARELVAKYNDQTKGMMAEIEATEKMVRDSVFYDTVSTDEMRAVYRAMASEFSGTGHWYKCANNHPFTVGECGMPMEQARCPECGAPVGGTNHTPVAGVQHANDIDNLARGLGGLGIN